MTSLAAGLHNLLWDLSIVRPMKRVYLDLTFFNEMEQRFKVAGDFAMAYVIAHEVGHHVQNLLGTSRKVQSMRSQLSESEYNKLSVRLELQADFLAGVWAHHAQKMENILEPGDIEEALNAASAVGDDALQKARQDMWYRMHLHMVLPQQRMKWFKKGFETGDIRQGDTFNTSEFRTSGRLISYHAFIIRLFVFHNDRITARLVTSSSV